MRELQGVGVVAGAVYDGRGLLEDQHLQWHVTSSSPSTTPMRGRDGIRLQPYRFANWSGPEVDRPSPTLGRDTREVLTRLTSLTEAEVDQMEADDVIGTIPLAARGD